jgi:hypothetical protein
MRDILHRLSGAIIFFSLVALPAHPVVSEPAPTWPQAWQADNSFLEIWSRTDGPVAAGAAARSWVWGPQPFVVANEDYAESPTGKRLVAYLDKARMEINDPRGDRAADWFVTSGLLVADMVAGRVQVGNDSFHPAHAANVQVAGDAGSPEAPYYSSFLPHTAQVTRAAGARVTRLIRRDGTLAPIQSHLPEFTLDQSAGIDYDPVSGHNIPAVFSSWSKARGTVLRRGNLVQDQVLDPLYVLGRPITEAYWADVLVAGEPNVVLVQLYERRALTFNPRNRPEWQVEMANVGRAYFDWRYSGDDPGPAIAAEVRPDEIMVRGWNWTPSKPVTVTLSMEGGFEPLSGLQSAQPGADGRFSLHLPKTPELDGFIDAKAELEVRAESGEQRTALPLGFANELGAVTLEGKITHISSERDGRLLLGMMASDSTPWTLTMNQGARLLFSEATPATLTALRTGVWARLEGTGGGGEADLTSLTLVSVSRTGAYFGITDSPDGKDLHITGAGWPAGKDVAFKLRAFDDLAGRLIATSRADSRGNLNLRLSAPQVEPESRDSLWLFASAEGTGGDLVQMGIPHDEPSRTPPTLSIVSRSGEQQGGLGSYCWETRCVDFRGIPTSHLPLLVSRAELLGLRSQYGPDPNQGFLPTGFNVDIYPYPQDPESQGDIVNGVFYFRPETSPLHKLRVPSRPFSVTLPADLRDGSYLLVISARWLAPSGSPGDSLYAFRVSFP